MEIWEPWVHTYQYTTTLICTAVWVPVTTAASSTRNIKLGGGSTYLQAVRDAYRRLSPIVALAVPDGKGAFGEQMAKRKLVLL